MCNSKSKKKLPPCVSQRTEKLPIRPRPSDTIPGVFLLVPVALALIFVADVEGGFPYKRVGGKSRIEGPIVPAPRNWGYRPTRWIRWETDIIHPSLGPVSPDAKKEVKTPEQEKSAEALSGPGETNSTAEESSPSEAAAEVLPPLPSDDGPPTIPPNLDEDLPPLPGEDFGPPSSNRATEKQTPQGTGPAEKPTFRDPDAIFDKSDGSKKPQATPRILPPLPKDGDPTAEPTTTPQPTKPTPSPATPQDRQTTPGRQPDSQLPAEQQPQWEKRSREKPGAPQEIQKQAPKKKSGEPFYDPDSIFNDRATRATGPEKVRWQKAGTVSPPSPHGPSGTTDRKMVASQMLERVFSEVKPVVPMATTPTAAPQKNPLSAAKTVAPALFEARPIPTQRATWKPAKNQNPPPTRQVPVRQDRQVRAVAFEQPVAAQPAANQRVLPTAPPVKVAAVGQRKAALPPAPPLNALSVKDSSLVARTTAVTRKIAAPVQKAKPVSSEKNLGAIESLRNPMRDPLSGEESENVSEENPLRENDEPAFETAAETQSKRSNPLR